VKRLRWIPRIEHSNQDGTAVALTPGKATITFTSLPGVHFSPWVTPAKDESAKNSGHYLPFGVQQDEMIAMNCGGCCNN
jgi:hypothetical protein